MSNKLVVSFYAKGVVKVILVGIICYLCRKTEMIAINYGTHHIRTIHFKFKLVFIHESNDNVAVRAFKGQNFCYLKKALKLPPPHTHTQVTSKLGASFMRGNVSLGPSSNSSKIQSWLEEGSCVLFKNSGGRSIQLLYLSKSTNKCKNTVLQVKVLQSKM